MATYQYERPQYGRRKGSITNNQVQDMQEDAQSRHARSMITVYGTDRIGRGSMLFSGPDGLRNFRMRVEGEHRYVGIGTMSPEGTSEVNYLWNAPRGVPHPRPKTALVGEIGWGIPYMTDWKATESGHQMKLKDFRQECEQRATHGHYPNLWYNGREESTEQDDPYWIGSRSPSRRGTRPCSCPRRSPSRKANDDNEPSSPQYRSLSPVSNGRHPSR